MQNYLRNHSQMIQAPLNHEGGKKKRYLKYYLVPTLILFLTACATTPTITQPQPPRPRPPMQPLSGEFTEEKIDSEVKYGDEILVFHKMQGQMPIRFVGVDKEYLFFRDIDETQNLYSVMGGKIHLKDIDRIEGIKRSESGAAPVSAAIGTSQSTQESTLEKTQKKWLGGGAALLVLIILIPLMFIVAP